MRIGPAFLLLLASGCAAGGARPAAQSAAALAVSPEMPLAEIPEQKLASGQCGLVLWQRAEPSRRIAFITNLPATARIVKDGKVIALARTGATGDRVSGHAEHQQFASADAALDIDITINTREGLTQGAIVPEGVLKYRTATGAAILPVFGLIGCN